MSKRRDNISPAGSLENPPAMQPKEEKPNPISDQEQRDVESRIHEIINNEIGPGGYLRLYRRRPMESDWNTITGRLAPDSFSTDWVFETFGGGEYLVKGFDTRHRLVKTATWKVDPSIPSKTPGAPGAPVPPAGSDATGIIRALKEGGAAPVGDNSALLTVLSGLMAQNTALIRTMAETRGGGDDTLKTLLPFLLKEKQSTPIDDMMKFAQFLDRAKKGEDLKDEDPKSPIESIAEKVLELLGPVLANKLGSTSTAAPAPAIVSQAPKKIQTPGRSVNPPPAPDASPDMNLILNQFRSMAINAAKKDLDPFEWTQGILEMVPDKDQPRVFALANSDAWFADIFGENSQEASKYYEYLLSVRNSVLTIAFANSADLARANTEKPISGEEFGKSFVGWACPTFRHELRALLDESEFLPELFSEYRKSEPAKKWLDEMAVAIKAAVQSEPEKKAD